MQAGFGSGLGLYVPERIDRRAQASLRPSVTLTTLLTVGVRSPEKSTADCRGAGASNCANCTPALAPLIAPTRAGTGKYPYGQARAAQHDSEMQQTQLEMEREQAGQSGQG